MRRTEKVYDHDGDDKDNTDDDDDDDDDDHLGAVDPLLPAPTSLLWSGKICFHL